MVQRYDSLMIGGGQAGVTLAVRAARHARVAFVERAELGGTCLNRGCIPTKTMIASAAVAHLVGRAGEYGVHAGRPEVDLAAVVDRKDRIVAAARANAYRTVEQADNLDFYPEEGRFEAGRRFRVNGTALEADRIFVMTGSRSAIPAIDGLDQVPYFTSTTMLNLRELPGHLVVVGGGYVGCEFAQMFRRFGAPVPVVQAAGRLLAAEAPAVSAVVADSFAAEGIDAVIGVSGGAGAIEVGCRPEANTEVATHLLIAAGRTPNSDGLGLEHLDLQPDPSGYLRVDAVLHTAADDVWALGDLRGGPMFTHTARDDADVVYRSVFRAQPRTTAGRIVPHAVFVDPEVAAVGLTETEARAAGYDVFVGQQEFAAGGKARAIGETRGFIKLVVDAADDRILGCHIVGYDAANLIHEAVTAVVAGMTRTALGRMVHIHPTLAEGMSAAAGGVHH